MKRKRFLAHLVEIHTALEKMKRETAYLDPMEVTPSRALEIRDWLQVALDTVSTAHIIAER